ncbi:MAG: STAS domain-containing protein [Christensenellaceae bacterium]
MEEVIVTGEGEVLSIALKGEIDSGNAGTFWEVVSSAYEKCPRDIVFDCGELAFVDSTTLGTFVKIVNLLKKEDRKVTLSGLQPKIKKLFLICNLDALMEIEQ